MEGGRRVTSRKSFFASRGVQDYTSAMSVAAPVAPHIVHDSHGVAWVDDMNVKVWELALDHLAYGWSAEAIHEQYPHLSMAQIHAALAYFYDHQAAFAEDLLRFDRETAVSRKEFGESALQRRMRQLKLAQ